MIDQDGLCVRRIRAVEARLIVERGDAKAEKSGKRVHAIRLLVSTDRYLVKRTGTWNSLVTTFRDGQTSVSLKHIDVQDRQFYGVVR